MYEGYTLDFISPWTYGIAKKMIARGLKTMINPFTGNLVINHHGKVFELKAIAKPLGIDLVFLIISSTEYAVWKIKDKGATLIMIDFDLSVVSEKESPGEIYGLTPDLYPSTLKSNDDENLHRYVIENLSIPSHSRYATYWSGWLLGLRNSFNPPLWNPSETQIWDVSYLYMLDQTDLSGPYPAYVCGTRRNYQIYEGKVIRDLQLMRVLYGTYAIQYDTKDGIQSKSVDALAPTDADKYHAVLNPDKYVGLTNTVITISASWEYYPRYEYGTFIFTSPTCHWEIRVSDDLKRNESASGYEYRFGDVLLESTGTYLLYKRGKKINIGSPRYCPALGTCERDSNRDANYYETISRSNTAMSLMDYDFAPDDDCDATFICFYYMSFTGSRSNKYYSADGWSYTAFSEDGAFTTFRMSYRINNGTLQQFDLATYVVGNVVGSSAYMDAVDSYPSCSGSWVSNPNDPDSVGVTYGNRIVSLSCKVTSKFLLYTYIKEDYNDPNWEFDERILGIIDIETGKRTEHTVDNSLLGDLYKDIFSSSKASAVGLHRR